MARAPTFEELFGEPPAARARAPGRVNLLGEHAGPAAGLALAIALPQGATAEVQPTDGATVRAACADRPGAGVVGYRLGEEAPGRGWLARVQGITRELAREGHAIAGFDVRVGSDVPEGRGLSSRAAVEVALLRALRAVFGLRLDDLALALAAQRAEASLGGTDAAGPLACSLVERGAALFVDAGTHQHERVILPPTLEVVVIASGVSLEEAAAAERARREECARAAAQLGVAQLRELEEADLARALALPEPLGRRARHVVTEDARVLAAVEALRHGDGAAAGALLDASRASQREDLDAALPEADLLAQLLRARPGVLGARLAGGRVGGAIVALARAGAGAVAALEAIEGYDRRSGRRARVLAPLRSAGGPERAATPPP